MASAATAMKNEMSEQIELPTGVSAAASESSLTMKGPKGEVTRRFSAPNASLAVEGNKVKVTSEKASKKEKKVLGSIRAHIVNMIKGVTEGHLYKLKVCYSHFPITVTVSGKKLTVKNFLGEKIPREVELPDNVKAKVEGGADLIIESTDKEAAGMAAGSIEQLTKRANYDTRVFADGIYITMKDGKEVK